MPDRHPAPTPEPGQTRDAAPRLPVLDGLRSLVILVLLVHFTDAVTFTGGIAVLRFSLNLAAIIALDVFFVLSGFLITGILLDTRESPRYFRTFYIRRCLRILPVYYGFLLMFLVVLPYATRSFPELRVPPAEQAYYWAYLVNIAHGLGVRPVAATGPLWSLAVEEQFYLVWPAVVYLCTRSQLRAVCLVCLLVAPVARLICVTVAPTTMAFYELTPARMDGLALGALIALGARSPAGLLSLRPWLRPVGIAALVMVAGAAIRARSHSAAGPFGVEAAMFLTASAWVAAIAFWITLTSGPDTRLARLVGSWPLRRVGTYSYAIYVLHYPLMHMMSRLNLLQIPHAGVAEALIYCAVMVPLTIGVGALSWHFYERPILRWQKSFAYQRRAS
jgi:peptidoglycan/LPS O-acetylase OafA/YrhL